MLQLRTERDGRVVVATFENPPHQLVGQPLIDALADLVDQTERDAALGAVLLTSAHPDRWVGEAEGPAGRSGGSADAPLSAAARGAGGLLRRVPVAGGVLGRTPVAGLLETPTLDGVLTRIARSRVAWVAELRGSAVGAGFALACACDLRYAVDGGDHRFGAPDPVLTRSARRLTTLVGRSLGLELLLAGHPIGPQEALEYGLVHHLVAAGDLHATALEAAHRLASRPDAGAAKRWLEDA